MASCPNLLDRKTRHAFNEALKRLRGRAMSVADVRNRSAYLEPLTPGEREAYDRAHALWDTHEDFAKIKAAIDHLDSLKQAALDTREAEALKTMNTPEWKASAEIPDKERNTAEADGYLSPEWKENRSYLGADGEAIIGFDNAARRLAATAESNIPGGFAGKDKRFFIVIGYPGAGKSTIAEALRDTFLAAHVTADDAKLMIPEYAGGANAGGVHKESAELALQAVRGLRAEGKNIIIEAVGSHTTVASYARRARELGYRVGLVHADVPKGIAMQRAVARYKQDGRAVPAETYKKLRADQVYATAVREGVVDESAIARWDEGKGAFQFVEASPELEPARAEAERVRVADAGRGGRGPQVRGGSAPEGAENEGSLRSPGGGFPLFARQPIVLPPGVGVPRGNRHGFERDLRVRVKVSPRELPEKPLFVQDTNNKNAPRQIAALDEVADRFPDPASSEEAWGRMMAHGLADTDVPIPPYGLIADLTSGNAVNRLSGMTPDQLESANEGLNNGKGALALYTSGQATPTDTVKLFLWSFLSRGVAPYVQEGLFIDAFPGIGQWADKAVQGNFTKADIPAYEAWVATVAPKGSGQPGAGAIHNLGAFGRNFLLNMARRNEAGVTHLQHLHDMLSDPRMTGQQIRREFLKFGEGVGIDNKVVSFSLLVSGRDDVFVLDRVQMRQFWDDGRFGDRNLYDGYTDENGNRVTGSVFSLLTYGARGLMVYEGIERSLQKRVHQIYSELGRPEAASVGRYHWESWLATSGQEASHGTLDAVLRGIMESREPMRGVTARQGEYGSFAYGARYGRDRAGTPAFLYDTAAGETYRFSRDGFRAFLEAIKDPRQGVVPRGFRVTESANAPWFERPEVNLAARDALIKRYGTKERNGSFFRRPDQAEVAYGTGPARGRGVAATARAGADFDRGAHAREVAELQEALERLANTAYTQRFRDSYGRFQTELETQLQRMMPPGVALRVSDALFIRNAPVYAAIHPPQGAEHPYRGTVAGNKYLIEVALTAYRAGRNGQPERYRVSFHEALKKGAHEIGHAKREQALKLMQAMRERGVSMREITELLRARKLWNESEWKLLVERANKIGVGNELAETPIFGAPQQADLSGRAYQPNLLQAIHDDYSEALTRLGLTGEAHAARLKEMLDQERVNVLIEDFVTGGAKYGTRVDDLISRIAWFFEAAWNALRGLGFRTADDVLEAGFGRELREGTDVPERREPYWGNDGLGGYQRPEEPPQATGGGPALMAINAKGQRLNATGTAAQWINRNERAVSDWQPLFKQGLPEVAKIAEQKFQDANQKEALEAAVKVDLGDYLKRQAENPGVVNQEIERALAMYERDPEAATKAIEEHIQTQRHNILERWYHYLVHDNPVYAEDPFWRDYVWTGLLATMDKKGPSLPPPLTPAAVAAVHEDITADPNNRPFHTLYADEASRLAVEESHAENKVDIGDDKQWVRVPQTTKDDPDFRKNADLIRALSCKSWCTAAGMADSYLTQGDFWILTESGETRMALRFAGGEVREIQGPANDGKIPVAHVDDVRALVDSGEIKLAPTQKANLDKAIARAATAKEAEALAAEGKYAEALQKMGLEAHEEADGGIIVDTPVSEHQYAHNRYNLSTTLTDFTPETQQKIAQRIVEVTDYGWRGFTLNTIPENDFGNPDPNGVRESVPLPNLRRINGEARGFAPLMEAYPNLREITRQIDIGGTPTGMAKALPMLNRIYGGWALPVRMPRTGRGLHTPRWQGLKQEVVQLAAGHPSSKIAQTLKDFGTSGVGVHHVTDVESDGRRYTVDLNASPKQTMDLDTAFRDLPRGQRKQFRSTKSAADSKDYSTSVRNELRRAHEVYDWEVKASRSINKLKEREKKYGRKLRLQFEFVRDRIAPLYIFGPKYFTGLADVPMRRFLKALPKRAYHELEPADISSWFTRPDRPSLLMFGSLRRALRRYREAENDLAEQRLKVSRQVDEKRKQLAGSGGVEAKLKAKGIKAFLYNMAEYARERQRIASIFDESVLNVRATDGGEVTPEQREAVIGRLRDRGIAPIPTDQETRRPLLKEAAASVSGDPTLAARIPTWLRGGHIEAMIDRLTRHYLENFAPGDQISSEEASRHFTSDQLVGNRESGQIRVGMVRATHPGLYIARRHDMVRNAAEGMQTAQRLSRELDHSAQTLIEAHWRLAMLNRKPGEEINPGIAAAYEELNRGGPFTAEERVRQLQQLAVALPGGERRDVVMSLLDNIPKVEDVRQRYWKILNDEREHIYEDIRTHWHPDMEHGYSGPQPVNDRGTPLDRAMLERDLQVIDGALSGEPSETPQGPYGGPEDEGGPPSLMAIAGSKAIGANISSRQLAQSLELRGRDAQSILRNTGWFRDADGEWAFEIDDSAAKVAPLKGMLQKADPSLFRAMLGARRQPGVPSWLKKGADVRVAMGKKLPEVLQHPKLFAAYPFLNQMRVSLVIGAGVPGEREGGALVYREKDGKVIYSPIQVRAKSEADVLGTLMHEVQHYIRKKEKPGRAAGSSTSMLEGIIPVLPLDYSRVGQTMGNGEPFPIRIKGESFSPTTTAATENATYSGGRPEPDWRTQIAGLSRAEQLALTIADTWDALDRPYNGVHILPDGAYDFIKRTGLWQGRNHAEVYSTTAFVKNELLPRLQAELMNMLRVRIDDYLNSVGEKEAELVVERLNYTPEQRRSILPQYPGQASKIVTRDFRAAADVLLESARKSQAIRDKWNEPVDLENGVFATRYDEDHVAFDIEDTEGMRYEMQAALDPENGRAYLSLNPEAIDGTTVGRVLGDNARNYEKPTSLKRLHEVADAAEKYLRLNFNLFPTADMRLQTSPHLIHTMSPKEIAFWRRRDPLFMWDEPTLDPDVKVHEYGWSFAGEQSVDISVPTSKEPYAQEALHQFVVRRTDQGRAYSLFDVNSGEYIGSNLESADHAIRVAKQFAIGDSGMGSAVQELPLPADLAAAGLDPELWKIRTPEMHNDALTDEQTLAMMQEHLAALDRQSEAIKHQPRPARAAYDIASAAARGKTRHSQEGRNSQAAWERHMREEDEIRKQSGDLYDQRQDVRHQITSGPLRGLHAQWKKANHNWGVAADDINEAFRTLGSNEAFLREAAKATLPEQKERRYPNFTTLKEGIEWFRSAAADGEDGLNSVSSESLEELVYPIIRKHSPAFRDAEERHDRFGNETERIGKEIEAKGGMHPYTMRRHVPRDRGPSSLTARMPVDFRSNSAPQDRVFEGRTEREIGQWIKDDFGFADVLGFDGNHVAGTFLNEGTTVDERYAQQAYQTLDGIARITGLPRAAIGGGGRITLDMRDYAARRDPLGRYLILLQGAVTVPAGAIAAMAGHPVEGALAAVAGAVAAKAVARVFAGKASARTGETPTVLTHGVNNSESLAHELFHSLIDHGLAGFAKPADVEIHGRVTIRQVNEAYRRRPTNMISGGKNMGSRPEAYANLRPAVRQAWEDLEQAVYGTSVEKIARFRALEREARDLTYDEHGRRLRVIGAGARERRARLQQVRLEAQALLDEIGTEITDYYRSGLDWNSGKLHGYSVQPTEMLARAFATYISDKARERGLAGGFHNVPTLEEELKDVLPREFEGLTPEQTAAKVAEFADISTGLYPQGEDRQRINAAWDNFFDALSTREDEQGNITLAAPMGVASESLTAAMGGMSGRDLDAALNDAADLLGIPARGGIVGGTRGAPAAVSRRHRVLDIANNGGRALMFMFGPDLQPLAQPHAAELAKWTLPNGDPFGDGFAKWFNDYIAKPDDARNQAPGFWQAFNDFLDAHHAQLLRSFEVLQEASGERANVRAATLTRKTAGIAASRAAAAAPTAAAGGAGHNAGQPPGGAGSGGSGLPPPPATPGTPGASGPTAPPVPPPRQGVLAQTVRWAVNGYIRNFQPELYSDLALQADPYVAAYRSVQAEEKDRIVHQGEETWSFFNKLTDPERMDYIQRFELGQTQPTPELQAQAFRHRQMMNRAFTLEALYGSKAGYVEEYLPHIYKDPAGVREWFQNRTTVVGPSWFERAREFELVEQAMAAGFELKTTNPEELVQMRLMAGVDMRARVALLHQLEQLGLARRLPPKPGETLSTPPGTTPLAPLTDVEATQLTNARWAPLRAPNLERWMLAPDVQALWENGVAARGLWSNEALTGSIFRKWMVWKNAIVPIRLAISGFHALHVAHINLAEGFARGYTALVRGGDVNGALRAAVEGWSPTGAAIGSGLGYAAGTVLPGGPWVGAGAGAYAGGMIGAAMRRSRGASGKRRMVAQAADAIDFWRKDPDARTPEEQEQVTRFNEGGFHPQLSEQLRVAASRGLQEALARQQRLRTIPRGLRRGIEKIQSPLFEVWIPRLKVQAYLNDTAALLQRRPDLLDNETQRRVAFRAIAKSIDNRFGEMFYSSLFWNRILKDAGIGSFLSMGWNLGFNREFLGSWDTWGAGMGAYFGSYAGLPGIVAGGIIGGTAGKYLRGAYLRRHGTETQRTIHDATNKAEFSIIYMTSAALILAMISKLLSGQDPEGEDYIFPRIGGQNPDGSPRRVSNMSYLREIPMFQKHVEDEDSLWKGARDMLWNKMMIEPFLEMVRNRDYYGYEIYSETNNLWRQSQQIAFDIFEGEGRKAWEEAKRTTPGQLIRHAMTDQLSPITFGGANRAAELSGHPFTIGDNARWYDPSSYDYRGIGESMTSKGVGLSMLGFGPAPGYVEKKSYENLINHYYSLYVQPFVKPADKAEIDAAKRETRMQVQLARQRGDAAGEQLARERGRAAGVTNVKTFTSPWSLYQFSKLGEGAQFDVLARMPRNTADDETAFRAYRAKARTAVKQQVPISGPIARSEIELKKAVP